MSKRFYPASIPSIGELEIQYVTDAVRSGWVSSLGAYVTRFEADFAAFCGVDNAISVSNGTVALHLALVGLKIGAGDEVIIPDLSFIATANAVLMSGAKPVFCDIDSETLCIDPDAIEALITPNTKAIIPVHLYGHPANMPAITRISAAHDLEVIEDAAEAHGAEIDGLRVGRFGHCATFSFYGNKNLTTGEGGMITTNDAELAERLRMLRDHAMSATERYWHMELGYNYRITNLQAAVGCAQLERADELLNGRAEVYEMYASALAATSGIRINRTANWAHNTYWMVCAEINGLCQEKRHECMRELRERGIDTRPYFYPMSDMPYLEPAPTPVAHAVSQIGINLPTYIGLTEADVGYISEQLITVVRDRGLDA